MKPLCIDLFCGLGGWAEGFLVEGYDVIGFDIERHDYGTGGYPGQLVLQDVLTLDGRQFRNAAVIVASPPCQEYSYMAMPWSRAKQIARALRGQDEFPEEYTGSRTIAELRALFDACCRLSEEAGVSLVIENVKGAQPWVGQARAKFGSFYLWGNVDSIGGRIVAGRLQFGQSLKPAKRGSKNNGGSLFAIGSPGQTNVGQNPVGRKIGVGEAGMSATHKPLNAGTKRMSGLRGMSHPTDAHPRDLGGPNDPRRFNSRSNTRKAASAQIAKIPFPLAQHIARVFKPAECAA